MRWLVLLVLLLSTSLASAQDKGEKKLTPGQLARAFKLIDIYVNDKLPEAERNTAYAEWLELLSGKSPVTPPPTGVLEKLQAEVLKLQADNLALAARVAALEGAKPPPIPPKKIAAHITFVGAEKTAVSRATQNDPNMEAFLTAAKIKIYSLKADSPKIVLSGLDDAVKAAGIPCAVLQDAEGNVIGQVSMGTTADVWTYTRRFLAGDK